MRALTLPVTVRPEAVREGRPSVHPVKLPTTRPSGPVEESDTAGLAEAAVFCAVVLARHAGTEDFVLPVLPDGPGGRAVHVPVYLTVRPSYRALLEDVK